MPRIDLETLGRRSRISGISFSRVRRPSLEKSWSLADREHGYASRESVKGWIIAGDPVAIVIAR